MIKVDFLSGWIVYPKGQKDKAKTVTLPHDAMLSEERSSESKGGKNIGWFLGGDYVYEKDFEVQETDYEKEIIFEFEGVYKNAEIYINDIMAGSRPYGYTNFYIDATKYLNVGKINTIKVIAHNSDQPNSRWYSGTGIYRPINMFILPKNNILINGLKVRTTNYQRREIEISVATNTVGEVKVSVMDGENLLVSAKAKSDGKALFKLEVKDAKLWSSDSPNLYKVRAEFFEDIRECSLGIRQIQCDSQNGLLINGKRTILYGACIHHDNGLLGAVAHPHAEHRKIKLLKEAGYNAIRSAHNPCSKALLEACDELGMMVLDEYADMWYIHKNKYDYADYLEEWWMHDLKDMVDKDYNHPSVIMYSIGNEVSETAQPRGIKLCEQMTKYLHTLDNRHVTCGINIFFNYLSSLGLGVYTDKKADKAIKKKKEKVVGSEFYNKLAGLFGDKVMKFGASLSGSDRKTKDAFAKLDIAGYNYGILRYKKDLKKYPDRVILGTETFCKDAYAFYELANQNKAIIGDFVWAGMDYIGEVGVGAWVGEDYCADFKHGTGWLTAGSGRLDITGMQNAEAAYTRVAFGLDDIRMAVEPISMKKIRHSPSAWKMSNAIESWSYRGMEGGLANIEVYTKAYRVSLMLNGKEIGNKKRGRNNCIIKFRTRYATGELTAVAYDKSGIEINRTSLSSASSETMLVLEAEQDAVPIDNGLIYVRIKLADANGNVQVLSKTKVNVDVENGELIGLGNACPYNPEGYLQKSVTTYYGKALAIIKPNSVGKVTINALCDYGNATIDVRVY